MQLRGRGQQRESCVVNIRLSKTQGQGAFDLLGRLPRSSSLVCTRGLTCSLRVNVSQELSAQADRIKRDIFSWQPPLYLVLFFLSLFSCCFLWGSRDSYLGPEWRNCYYVEIATQNPRPVLLVSLALQSNPRGQEMEGGTFLVVQWLRICLPVQGTWVWFLVWEDPTCCRATEPMRHHYRSLTTLEPELHNKRSHHNASQDRKCPAAAIESSIEDPGSQK